MSIKVVGIDIAKNLFQVCVLGTNGQKWFRVFT
ncbi:hypothetical protein VagYM19_26840 [Vibrio alginolyticus]|nr:hypothetical protein Vag1382_26810 [Vibrio alginolyticus]BCB48155.1 hypothetical protein VagVIO5_26810 [Vibrio alginolyticus]BCB52757.1 hypothetical protein VagYM19_26840 [Vibrio alginolyticus]BCB57360.1 hypothetical protein VagYM4_26830 [Vibrio alginolyticus]